MNTWIIKVRDKHALWYKGIIYIVCVLLCVYLLPKENRVSLEHKNVGDIWTNENLIAKQDFLIKKTNEEIESEKKNQQAIFPYYLKIETNDSLFNYTAINKHLQNIVDSIIIIGIYDQTAPIKDSNFFLVENNEVGLTHFKNHISLENAVDEIDKLTKDSDLISKLKKNLKPNLIFDEALSKEINKNEISEINIYKSKFDKGDVIVFKNEILSPEKINLLESYYQDLSLNKNNANYWMIVVGQFIICVLVFGIMMLFLAFFRKVIFSQNTHITFILLITMLIILSASIVSEYNSSYLFAVPFCLVPILIRVFFDSRTALFNFLTIILLCSFFSEDKFEFVFIQLITGIGTIFSVADMGKRSKLFISVFLILLFYVITFASYHLVNDNGKILLHLNSYIPFLISALCVLFSYPLIYLFEKLFGFTSDFTLLELCDLNFPLLRELSQKVPGTFQHSLQVANLAEEACYKIGGNALLVRAGAMYHDIGKLYNPRFFTENQVGEVSPHEDLSAKESAKIIIDHVIKGIEIAKSYKLPEAIIDFIRTHHGTTTTRYFLYNYKKEHQEEIINEDLFRYPGPIPFSKETAILMMADGVEASSRSLKKYDAVSIDELVDNIINHQINENQFINADITYRDINQIKKIFKKRLMNIYHVRIEYPR
jgi:putative nucleotidyltransferase with HDIG domain